MWVVKLTRSVHGFRVTSLERKVHQHQALQSSTASDLTARGAGPTVHIHWCVDQQEKELGCPGRQRRRPESSRLVTHVEGEEVVDRIGPADEGLPISSNMLFAAVHGLASQLG
jgi:hypothetical protein